MPQQGEEAVLARSAVLEMQQNPECCWLLVQERERRQFEEANKIETAEQLQRDLLIGKKQY